MSYTEVFDKVEW